MKEEKNLPSEFKYLTTISTPLVLEPVFACKLWLVEWIIVRQIHYWLEHNEKSNVNIHNDMVWCYNSVKEWKENNFPFLSEATIKRALAGLEKMWILLSDSFSKSKFDKRKWYTINYAELKKTLETPSDQSIGSKWPNREDQNDQIEESKLTKSNRSKWPNLYTETTTETTTEINIQESIIAPQEKKHSSLLESSPTDTILDNIPTTEDDEREQHLRNVEEENRIFANDWTGNPFAKKLEEKRKQTEQEQKKQESIAEQQILDIQETIEKKENKKSLAISKNINTIAEDLLEYWNSKNILKHTRVNNDIKRHLTNRLAEYSIDEIKKSIDIYNVVLKDPRAFFKFKRTLAQFLQRENWMRWFLYQEPSNFKQQEVWQDRPDRCDETITKKLYDKLYWYEDNTYYTNYMTMDWDSLATSNNINKFVRMLKLVRRAIANPRSAQPVSFWFKLSTSDVAVVGYAEDIDRFYISIRWVKVVYEYADDDIENNNMRYYQI